MKIAIVGFGREGQSLYQYLKKEKDYKKAEFWLLDQNKNIKIPPKLRTSRILNLRLGVNYLNDLDQFDLIFRSPGIPYNIVAQRLQNLKLEIRNSKLQKITSATKLFFDKCPCPIVGITGTKGKTTTATLIYEIFKNCGWDVYLAGNVGKPALDILPQLKKDSLAVVELSSFQLQDLTKSPSVAVVLEIFPDHQDAHLNFKEYLEAKSQIVRRQNSADKVFYCFRDRNSSKVAKLSLGEKIAVDEKKFNPLMAGRLLIPGRHNALNALMAFSVAQSFGCPTNKILKTIFDFKGVEHRLEFVKTLRLTRDGCAKFYNDSASTNPGTTIAAVKSFGEPKILIAGGKDKNLSYEEWPKIFLKNKVRAVVLCGENSNKIYKAFRSFGFKSLKFKVIKAKNLREVVILAKKIAQAGDIVLFSPGAASFDMFRDYIERGIEFKKIVNNLKF